MEDLPFYARRKISKAPTSLHTRITKIEIYFFNKVKHSVNKKERKDSSTASVSKFTISGISPFLLLNRNKVILSMES